MVVKPAIESVRVSCKAAESATAEAATREMPAAESPSAALTAEATRGEAATAEAPAADESTAPTGEPSGATTCEAAARVSTAEPSSTVP